MRQRLGIAEILMKDAQIAILDEPTSGLDPQATIELLEIIRNLKHENVTVLLSSHLLDRVQSVCDRVALFSQGNIVLLGSVDELGRKVLGGTLQSRSRSGGLAGSTRSFGPIPGVGDVESAGPEPMAAEDGPRRPLGGASLRWRVRAASCCGCRPRRPRSRPSTPAISATSRQGGRHAA